jgi:carbonic anhydrase/acetyltransferase-like protein (isoleucine patch superfamily)
MLIEHEGRSPTVAPTAYVAPTAVVCGDVRVGDRARVLFGAVLTAAGGSVEVGEQCIVMENAVVRGRERHPARLGRHVIVGPHAHVNGAVVGDDCFLATGSSLFPGAVVGAGSEVRIGAVVQVNTVLAPGTTVPIHWVAAGDPARLFPPDRHDELWEVQRSLDFPGTVFGIAREDFTMERATAHHAELFGRHRGDRTLEG